MQSGVLPISLPEMFVQLQRPRARGPATFAVLKRRLLPNSSVAEHAARPTLTMKTVELVEPSYVWMHTSIWCDISLIFLSAQLAHLARRALANVRTAD